jgi:hypothetical protein
MYDDENQGDAFNDFINNQLNLDDDVPLAMWVVIDARDWQPEDQVELSADNERRRLTWPQRLLGAIVLSVTGVVILLFVLNGGRSQISRTMDDLQATISAQTAQIIELQATVEGLPGMP